MQPSRSVATALLFLCLLFLRCRHGEAQLEAHSAEDYICRRNPSNTTVEDFYFLAITPGGLLLYHEWSWHAIMAYDTTTHEKFRWAGSEASYQPVTAHPNVATKRSFQIHKGHKAMCTGDWNLWYVLTLEGHRVYELMDDEDTVAHIVGTGSEGLGEGNGLSSAVSNPRSCAVTQSGFLFFSDGKDGVSARIMQYDPVSKSISVVAGQQIGGVQGVSSGPADSTPIGFVPAVSVLEERATGHILFSAGDSDGDDNRFLFRLDLEAASIENLTPLKEDSWALVPTHGGRWLYQLHDNGDDHRWYRYDAANNYTTSRVGLGGGSIGDDDGVGAAATFGQMRGGAFSNDDKTLWFGHRFGLLWYPRYVDGFAGDHFDVVQRPTPPQTATSGATATLYESLSQTESSLASQSETVTITEERSITKNSSRAALSVSNYEESISQEPTAVRSPDRELPTMDGALPSVTRDTHQHSTSASHTRTQTHTLMSLNATTAPQNDRDGQPSNAAPAETPMATSTAVAFGVTIALILVFAVGSHFYNDRLRRKRIARYEQRQAERADAATSRPEPEHTVQGENFDFSNNLAPHQRDTHIAVSSLNHLDAAEEEEHGTVSPTGSAARDSEHSPTGIATTPAATFVNVSKSCRSFEMQRVLASGATGRVYEALHHSTKELIAVKEIDFSGFESELEEKLPVLRREIESMRRLQHPNVVQYIGAERDGSAFFVLMELVRGGSVRSWLDRQGGGGMQASVLKHLLQQLLAGLTYVHAQGLVHRDLKCDNILIDESTEERTMVVKLADFGSARMAETSMRTMAGTPLWIAPEVMFGEPATAASDIWSLGCVVLELLTGERPWAHLGVATDAQLLYRLMGAGEGAPVELPDLHDDGDALDFLRCCLQRDPLKRSSVECLQKHRFLSGAGGVSSDVDSADSVSIDVDWAGV